jgi:hypothetical protein
MQLVELVKALPPAAKGCWREATYRTFDVALDAPEWFRGAGVPLGQRTVEAVASVGGRIVITLYPPDAD